MSTKPAIDGVSDELSDECPKLAEAINALTDELKAAQERIDDLETTVDELETELAEHKDHSGREFADVRARITDVENQQTEGTSDDATPGVEAGEDGASTTETPLERICALPEHIAGRELTINQERARFIARDVRDYAEKAPAGLVIDSRAIKRVITASEGKRPHTQTVARVMDFLDDLGKQDVQQKKRRGKKLIIVEPEAATRYATHHDRCDGGDDRTTDSDVIASS